MLFMGRRTVRGHEPETKKMQMFAVQHETFNYVTTDKDLVIERICQGYAVRAIDYLRQSIEGTGKRVRVIDYGRAGMLLSY